MPESRILVLEKNRHPVPEAAFKVGESTVEVATHYFTRVLGLEEHMKEDQLPKLGLRFFFPAGDNSAIQRRLELGGHDFPPTPSYQIDRGRFENFLAQRCQSLGIEFPGVTLPGEWSLADVELDTDIDPKFAHVTAMDDRMVFLISFKKDRWRAASNRPDVLKHLPSRAKVSAVHWESDFTVSFRQAKQI